MFDRNEFIFKDYLSPCCRSADAKQISEIRLNSVQEASIKRKESLNNYLSSLEQSSFVAHKNCFSTYPSKSHIVRHFRKDRSNQRTSKKLWSSKRPTQSEVSMFKWLQHSFFCGIECDININPKHLINGESHTSVFSVFKSWISKCGHRMGVEI